MILPSTKGEFIMVAIIDYNVGNVKSLQFALERLGVKSILTNDYGLIKKSESNFPWSRSCIY